MQKKTVATVICCPFMNKQILIYATTLRYSDEHVEQLLSELLSVLENIRRRPIFP